MPLKLLPTCTTIHSVVETILREPRKLERIYLTLGIVLLLDLKFFGSKVTNEILFILVSVFVCVFIVRLVVSSPRARKTPVPASESVWTRKHYRFYFNECTGESTYYLFTDTSLVVSFLCGLYIGRMLNYYK